jgi:uridine kinase
MTGSEKPFVIAIAGGSGAGKTWLADRLEKELGGAGRIVQDDFYRDQSHLSTEHRASLNFDDPRMIEWTLLEKALDKYREGSAVSVPRYDFATHSRRPEMKSITVRKFLLVDGLWLLRKPALRRRFNLRIYIECPEEIRLQRRLQRDTVERGRTEPSVRQQFATTVQPMHKKFVEAQARWADIVLHAGFADKELERIIRFCKPPPV